MHLIYAQDRRPTAKLRSMIDLLIHHFGGGLLPVYVGYLPSRMSSATWGAITLQAVYQGVVIAFLGAGLYSYAVQKIGAGEASSMLALVSAVSAVGGLLILGEQLRITAVVGIVVVSIGALLGALPPGELKLGSWFRAR